MIAESFRNLRERKPLFVELQDQFSAHYELLELIKMLFLLLGPEIVVNVVRFFFQSFHVVNSSNDVVGFQELPLLFHHHSSILDFEIVFNA